MPEKAVELMIYVSDLVEDDREAAINRIWQIVSENGFHATPGGDKVQALALYFQPFEDTEQNEELIRECVKQIETEFSDLDVEYSIGENRDAGKRPGKTCQITVNT